MVGLWQHQEGLSGYAWEHHLKDKHRHSHHSLRVFLGQEYPYKGYFRSRIHPLRVFQVKDTPIKIILGRGYPYKGYFMSRILILRVFQVKDPPLRIFQVKDTPILQCRVNDGNQMQRNPAKRWHQNVVLPLSKVQN